MRALVASALPRTVRSRQVDAMGNLLVQAGSGRGPKVLLLAHMDEVGLMVSGHTPEGHLRIRPWGGVPAVVVPGNPVLVGADCVPGAIGWAPHQLTRGSAPRTPTYDDLYVDIGAADAAAARRLAPVGEMVTFHTPYTVTPDGATATGKAFDDRAGVYLALALLAEDWDFPLHVAFTVQEEVGLRGAQVALRAVQPDLVLALEATAAADTPETPAGLSTRLGGGPALTTVDRATLADRGLRQALCRAGDDAGVPWQWRRGVGGGNEAGAAWHQGYRAAALSIPCRYLHAPVSRIHLGDLRAAEALLRSFLAHVQEVASDV